MTKHRFDKFARFALAFVFILAATAYGGVPPIHVTVSDAGGKVAFRGPINANATFATSSLEPGEYVVQFKTVSASVKGNQYLLVVSAGNKKVIASEVAGETFTRGGAAMKIHVDAGSNITGQVANDQAAARVDGTKYRIVDGKRYLWVSSQLGSNRGGHWEEESLIANGKLVVWNRDELQKRMDRGGEGSMITTESNEHHGAFKGY